MSILLKKTNFSKGALNAGITNVATSFTLQSGQGSIFPATGAGNPFRGVFWSASYSTPEQDTSREIVECYRSSGDVFTVVTRGAEGTTAKAWSSSDNFALVLTTGVLSEIESEFSNYASATSTTTFTNKTFDDAFIGKQIATPSNPSSGYNKLYFKSDNNLYKLNSAGTEVEVGAGGSIGGSTGSTTRAILIANGTGGSTLQATGITIDSSDNIILPTAVANDQKGIIYRGSTRWLHGYYPTTASGNNVFLGGSAGNFTMTAGGGAHESSNLIGIGASVLSASTGAYQIVAIGTFAFQSATTASLGVGIGTFAFQKNNGTYGTAVGQAAGRYVTTGGTGNGYGNTLLGSLAGQGVDTVSNYGYATCVGTSSGIALTTGTVAGLYLGSFSGANVTSGQSNIILATNTTAGTAASTTTGSSNIIIGNGLSVSANSASNEMNIGGVIYGTGLYGTGKIGIGVTNANITARLHLAAGTTSAASAPLKFISGSLMSSAEAGAMEFLTDAYYLTITTGAARQQIVTDTNTVTMTNKTLTSPTLTTPVLGTPSSGTLTNCTQLPISGLVGSTSTAIGVGTIELGHASDTTIARVSAGVISVEGVTVPTISSTSTFTNKRITQRVGTTASSATPTPDADANDMYTVTALAAGATFGAPTGTPTDGQKLMIRIKDNGTARTLAFNAIYRAIGVTLPTTTVISKTIYLGAVYNSADTKWDILAYSLEA